MKLACLRAGQLLQRRALGLSAPEGLRLEEHLAHCTSCRAEANLLSGLSRLADEVPSRLSEGMRERAIAGAWSAAVSTRLPTASHMPRRLLLAAAALLIVAGGFALGRSADTTTPKLAQSLDRVLSGKIEVAGTWRGEGANVSDQAAVYTTTGARLALAHAQVELRPQSEASWDALARTLRLQRGSVLIEVDPTQQRSFSVETASFTVHVLGTRFVVTERGVYVERGRVSVQLKASDHEHTPMILAAGSEQARFELPPIEKVDAATETAASAPPEPRTPQPVPRPSATDATLDPNVLLEQARAQLAARELTQARRTLGRAAPKLNKATQRAEALSLEAECNLLEGRFSAASDSYLRVAKRYADLPAAETALFAAARIEDEHGQPPRARALLDQYLARYPKGSYVREVEHRLQSLARRAPAEPSQ